MRAYFEQFRKNIIGINTSIKSPFGKQHQLIYADWIASGRNYATIEQKLQQCIMPLVANTHTEVSTTGSAMTYAYHKAQQVIKQHVNAAADDIIITACSGMTRLINKFQRILHLKDEARVTNENDRPVVFVTHMEHHSNQTSWLETIVDTVIINATPAGLVDLNHFEKLLQQYKDRSFKIASVTSCSNVTGIATPYHQIAEIIHQYNGYCFVDFACSAPYEKMDMHPADEAQSLDAILFSPHKFLGGPGSAGVLIFNKKLYNRTTPDNPGGGTVDWTNPWGQHKYINEIETREDGGTPAFLQTIKSAMCVVLKDKMGVDNILKREHELLQRLWQKVENVEDLHILAPNQKNRLAVFSFYINDLHYNLGVRLLNDYFGVQCRGGCSCAGTYGHYLLNVDESQSAEITDLIDKGDYSKKPGWIRISLHPTMLEEEIDHIAESIKQLAANHKEWSKLYTFDHTYSNLTHKNCELDLEVKQQIHTAITELA